MGTRTAAIAAAAAVALLAACGKDKCPTESPAVTKVPDCTAAAGQAISYPVQLCPTCNQTFSSCDVQIAGSDIFLNPVVEACSGSSSCPAGCDAQPSGCSFTVPTSGGPTFTVSAYDAAHPNTPQVGTLTLGGSFSCSPL